MQASPRMAWCLPCLLVLAACGGGGGGSGSDGGQPSQPSEEHLLGSRAVPGFLIEVEQVEAPTAGRPYAFRATVTADPDGPPPQRVDGALSAGDPAAWTAGTPVAGSPATWTWTVLLPADTDGLRIWVRIVDADGNEAQSGGGDFALPAP